ncbi:MAG: type II secretion system protein [Patescibacteria group bacterium]|jgi:hypothetical protein
MLFKKENKTFALINPAVGFTLIEALISLAIFTFLSTVAFASYKSYERRLVIQSVTQELISVLETAKNRTIESLNASSYGVHLLPNSFTLFGEGSYVAGNPANEVHQVPADVELYAISVGGGSDVMYDRVRGSTANSGTIGIRLVSDPNVVMTVSVPALAPVGLQHTIQTAGSRLTDARHVHVTLGWSIQNATTLELVFKDSPNPDTVENVAIANYLNADQTVFDWEGTQTVNGQPQVVHISSHELNGSNTILSIRRDGRYNSINVDIKIDGQTIVSYGSDNEVVLGGAATSLAIQ